MTDLNIGDMVEFNCDFGTRRKGDRGVVEAIDWDGHDTTVTVLMETENKHGTKTAQPFAFRLTKIEAQETPQARRDLIEMVKATSVRVGTRNVDAIFKSLVEEVGELSTELAIEAGTKKRDPSPDGVVGEAIDVLVVVLDLLHLKLGNEITGQAFLDRVQSKLNKWEGKVQ